MAALGALYKAASQQTVTLADKGYVGAGIGVLTPIKGTRPCPYDATYNLIQAALRAPAERANAMLKHFKALRRVSLDPSTITRIAPPSWSSPPPQRILVRKAQSSWPSLLLCSCVHAYGELQELCCANYLRQ